MEETDLKDLFLLFWNRKAIIILLIIIFCMFGFFYTGFFITPKYTSSTTLLLASQDDSTSSSSSSSSSIATDLTVNSKLVATYSELVKSKTVLRQVISNLGIDIAEDTLRSNVSVTAVTNTELIEISVTNENPSYAANIANEIATVFIDEVKDIYNINNVYVVDKAEAEYEPSNVNYKKNIIIFGIVGLVIATIIILLENMLDTTIKSESDIEKGFSLPVLASIPVEDYKLSKGEKR